MKVASVHPVASIHMHVGTQPDGSSDMQIDDDNSKMMTVIMRMVSAGSFMRATFICIRCLICGGYGGWTIHKQEDEMYGGELDFGTLGRVTDEVQEGPFSRHCCLVQIPGQSFMLRQKI